MLKKNDWHENVREPVVNRDKNNERPGRPDVKRDTCHELKQGPVGCRSFGYICPGEPHQRSPNAPKFEDRSQEETEWQEQGAREAKWKLAKSVLNLKGEKQSNILLTIGK